jgi:multiple sugar transport system substrate-binding protein
MFMRTRWKPFLIVLFLIFTLGIVTVQAQDPTTIHVLTMQQAAMTPEEMQSVADEFNAANPGIKVELEFVSYDALHDKIVTSMATNPPPYDAILSDVIWYPEFVKSGYLADVTDRVTDDEKNNIFQSAWNVVTVDDKEYGMPWLLDTKYLCFNQDMLKQAGFDKGPTTWEELAEQAKAIKDKGIVEYPIVWSWAQQEAAICDFVALVYGNGGQFLDDAGKPVFNNEAGVQALQWMVQTIDDGLTNPSSITYVEEDVRNVFSSGGAAFALNWLYMYDLANLNKDESQVTGQVQISTIPVFAKAFAADVTTASVDGSMGFSVTSTSTNQDAAWSFLQYLTSEATQLKYSSHQLPIWKTSYEGDTLKELMGQTESAPITVPAFSAQFQFAHVRPRIPYYVEGSKALQLALQLALTKQETPQQALDEAAAKWVEMGSQ